MAGRDGRCSTTSAHLAASGRTSLPGRQGRCRRGSTAQPAIASAASGRFASTSSSVSPISSARPSPIVRRDPRPAADRRRRSGRLRGDRRHDLARWAAPARISPRSCARSAMSRSSVRAPPSPFRWRHRRPRLSRPHLSQPSPMRPLNRRARKRPPPSSRPSSRWRPPRKKRRPIRSRC